MVAVGRARMAAHLGHACLGWQPQHRQSGHLQPGQQSLHRQLQACCQLSLVHFAVFVLCM